MSSVTGPRARPSTNRTTQSTETAPTPPAPATQPTTAPEQPRAPSTAAAPGRTATVQSGAEAAVAVSHDVRAGQLLQRATGSLGHGTTSSTAPTEGHGVNRGSGALRSASGTLPADAWSDPARHILGHLTQHSATGAADGQSDPNRCGAANLLGAAVMNGQEPTARLLERTAGDSAARLSDGDRGQLRIIARDVREGRATYEQLSAAQDLIYRGSNSRMPFEEAMEHGYSQRRGLPTAERREFETLHQRWYANRCNEADVRRLGELSSRASGVSTDVVMQRDGGSTRVEVDVRGTRAGSDQAGGMTDAELRDAATRAGAAPSAQQLSGSFDRDGRSTSLRDLVAGLRPGQAATVRVGGSAESARAGLADHFVTVGRQPDGTAYIYNPDPTQRRATVFVGGPGAIAEQPRNFMDELRAYEDRVQLSDDNGQPVAATVVTAQ